MDLTDRHAIIVGAGLAGSLLACDLARHGCRVTLLERRPDPRARGYQGGRSINLALSTRGITALSRLGLADAVLAQAVAMPGRMVHAGDGSSAFQPYSADGRHAIQSVSRGGLNMQLIQAATAERLVDARFEQRCVDIELPNSSRDARPAVVAMGPDGSRQRIEADVVIGADGAFSAVREWFMRTGGFDYTQSYLSHSYRELHIRAAPELRHAGIQAGPGARDAFALEPHALHIWPRTSRMMIALPNRDGSFTCTLFWPRHGPGSFEQVDALDDAGVMAHFEREIGSVTRLMPTLLRDYRANPASTLVTIRCQPWQIAGRVLLLGDAAHAIVPFYGQGMNAAFEDCRVLMEMLEAGKGDLARVLPEFAQQRKPQAEAIADMALHNFIEMRDLVARPAFRAKKKLEHALSRMLPGVFVPLYDMVSFSNIPYASARRRARTQWRVVAVVAALIALLAAGPFAWWTGLLG